MTFFVKRCCRKLVLRIKRSLSTGRQPWYRGYFGCVPKELYSSFLFNRIYNTVTVVFVIRCKHSISLFPHRISCSHTTWRFNDVLLLITNKQTKINHLLSKLSINSCKAQTSNISAPKQHDKLPRNLPSHQLSLISSSNIWRKLNKMRPSLDHLRYILEKVKWYTNKSAIFL